MARNPMKLPGIPRDPSMSLPSDKNLSPTKLIQPEKKERFKRLRGLMKKSPKNPQV